MVFRFITNKVGSKGSVKRVGRLFKYKYIKKKKKQENRDRLQCGYL